MLHYHGGPIWPQTAAITLWTARHGLTSFARPEQTALMAELCQSFILDCGAYTLWKQGGGTVDIPAYSGYVDEWELHPGFDFAIIPDDIEGDEKANDDMLERWFRGGKRHGVPVWHLHESLERLARLAREHTRIALGSSGKWATVGADEWWDRMEEVRPVVTDERGRPIVKLHGLRMLNPTIFAHIPLASADSCNVALNIGKDVRWSGTYQPLTENVRSLVLAERIERHACAAVWSKRRGTQMNLDLIG